MVRAINYAVKYIEYNTGEINYLEFGDKNGAKKACSKIEQLGNSLNEGASYEVYLEEVDRIISNAVYNGTELRGSEVVNKIFINIY